MDKELLTHHRGRRLLQGKDAEFSLLVTALILLFGVILPACGLVIHRLWKRNKQKNRQLPYGFVNTMTLMQGDPASAHPPVQIYKLAPEGNHKVLNAGTEQGRDTEIKSSSMTVTEISAAATSDASSAETVTPSSTAPSTTPFANTP